jgi:uncharacterized RDD family membrane protein YckC
MTVYDPMTEETATLPAPPPVDETPPSPPEDGPTTTPPAADIGASPTPGALRRPTLAELALGGALLVGDNVGSRMQVVDVATASAPRTLESVLRPATEWDTAPPTPLTTARHVTVGALTDARAGADRAGRFLYDLTDVVGQTIDDLTRPLRRSRMMQPVRLRFRRYQQRGEQEVNRWEAQGRREELRSRTVAEASLGSLMERSVNDLTQSQQVQVLVQQVVESQSTGLVEEFIEEIRERMVSLDTLLDRRLRPSARTEPLVTPPFRRAYLHGRPALMVIPQAGETLAGHYAGFASRSVAFLIDVTLLMIALSLGTTFINSLFGLLNVEALLGRFMPSDVNTGALAAAIGGLLGTLLVFVYGVLGWSINGQTVGDILLGVRVVRADGNRISLGRAITRMVGAYLAGFVLFIGFFWALFDRRRQGWHDKLAGTAVVYDWPAVPDELFLRAQLGVRGVLPRQQLDPGPAEGPGET